MSLDAAGLQDKVISHALTLGVFESVSGHEPKSAPGSGVTAAAWVQNIGPAPRSSGLARTSARVEFKVRIYQNMLAEPQDAIDPNIIAAVDALFAAYSSDFDLDASVKQVDLLGAYGQPLFAQAGYINQDGRMYRIMDVTLPLIVNDVWDQNA